MVNLLTVYVADDSVRSVHGIRVLLESQLFLQHCKKQSI